MNSESLSSSHNVSYHHLVVHLFYILQTVFNRLKATFYDKMCGVAKQQCAA